MNNKLKITLVSLITLALIGGGVYGGYQYSQYRELKQVDSFDDCLKIKNATITQTSPTTCHLSDGRSFTEEVSTKEISFSTFIKGAYCDVKSASNYVIKDQKTWEDLYKTAFISERADLETNPNKQIDFDKYMLLAVFQGEKNTGGYYIAITKILEKSNSLEVTYGESSPNAEEIVTQALTYPYHVVKIPKTTKKINFVRSQDRLLKDGDNGTTVDFNLGDTIIVILNDPGDGGYVFDEPQYDKSVLELTNTDQAQGDPNLVGDFGEDIWTFRALKTGSTNFKVTATRPWDKNSTVTEFETTINIK